MTYADRQRGAMSFRINHGAVPHPLRQKRVGRVIEFEQTPDSQDRRAIGADEPDFEYGPGRMCSPKWWRRKPTPLSTVRV
jgi:hypothetical protein